MIHSVNPYTKETLQSYQVHNSEAVKEKIAIAQATFESWRATTFDQRKALMENAANILRKDKARLAKLITLEMGKVLKESIAEIEKCAWACDFYASHAERFLSADIINLPEENNAKVVYDPLGIVLAIMPWNFPFWQVFRFAAPTLMAGNVGLLKHASNVPQCALAIEEVFIKAGFPVGCFQTLVVGSDMVADIIAHEHVQAVTLTGSEGAGSKVAELAGKHIKKSVLELGGSDPFIVLADADVEKAAQTAVKARMINFGQSCIAAKRFIVVEAVYEEFLSIFKAEMAAQQQGDPLQEETDYACMARADLAMELWEQVEASIQKGAKALIGGIRPEADSALFSPTILTDVQPGMPAYEEELFGPVASIIKAKDTTDAIRIANDSRFGLGASLWSKDLSKAEKIARQIESGGVFINSLVASNPYLPFGGIKKSGYGRELSKNGIREFVNIKTLYFG
ncbi:NAD-dependent succinate-semialdehyde dehydrogenase [Penaeicola halotolerans]|uniref:NAD-dependent succinate-semialdehyde dehydrogenase n=1 Tax=Penaeicola halotolerans TaxID=2793196 RepID=UPI001CF86BC1|nr:NAD-dependent succinate-semialdehyde dehydrogenase [Penaeicola halotolerans]